MATFRHPPARSRFWHAAAAFQRHVCALLPALAVALCFAASVAADQPEGDAVEDELEIKSDSMDMDFAQRKAVFEGNVRVSDSRMKLRADRMEVFLSPQDELQRIEAAGNVVIEETATDRKALAGKAVYDVEQGRVVLTEDPVLHVGENSMTGAFKITYSRAEGKFRSEGREGEQPVIRWKTKHQGGDAVPAFLKKE